jgi:hypothetical protein
VFKSFFGILPSFLKVSILSSSLCIYLVWYPS